MLEKYHNLQPKPKTITELNVTLELIWEDLPLEPINKAIKNFTKRLRTCVGPVAGHTEHNKNRFAALNVFGPSKNRGWAH